MFIRPIFRKKGRKRHAYWALVESVRTEKGPRQRVVGYIGGLPEQPRRRRVQLVEEGQKAPQAGLFPDEDGPARYAEVIVGKVRTENARGFGGPWLALHLARTLGLDRFLAAAMPPGQVSVP
jgi:hypothetical protein